MASSNRTYDAVIRFAAADRGLARCCARRLAAFDLRVALAELVSGHPIDAGPPVARADLMLMAGNGATFQHLGARPGAVASSCAPLLLAPRLRPGDRRAIGRQLDGELWDLGASWNDPALWRRLRDRVVDAGFEAEHEIEPRFALASDRLKATTIQSYDRIAEQFAEHWYGHPPMPELERFMRRLAPRSLVLDAGCGPGHHAAILARAGHQVAGIDLSDGMLDQARRRTRSVSLTRMDIEALEFPRAGFDAIWCAASVLHVPAERLARVLRGFRRVLRPDGLLGLNFQVGRPSELVQRGADARFFEYYPDRGAMAARLRAFGFHIESALDSCSARNTHGLDMILDWSTLYARRLTRYGSTPAGHP